MSAQSTAMEANMADDIYDIIRKHQVGFTYATDNSSLRDDLHLDGIDMMSIAADIEEGFGILIGDTALENAQTVGDLLNAVWEAGR
jgi:acyl carrier protein